MSRVYLTLIGLFSLIVTSSGQCGEELMKQALSEMGSYQYIKDFDIKLPAASSKTGTKYSVVLNSRTKYQVNVANGSTNAENVILQIFDGDKLLGTNFYNGKTYNVFKFICSKTGAYKLNVFCNGGTDACARAVLSLVEQYSDNEMPK